MADSTIGSRTARDGPGGKLLLKRLSRARSTAGGKLARVEEKGTGYFLISLLTEFFSQ